MSGHNGAAGQKSYWESFHADVTVRRGPWAKLAKSGAWDGYCINDFGERSKMSTVAATETRTGGMTKDERFVILASSLGTVFEWYDFYLYGSLASIIGAQFFSRLSAGHARHLRAAGIRRGLPRSSVRRHRVRPRRRHRRPQIHLPRHHPDHGPVDLHRRPAAERGHHRHCGADHPDRVAPGAGSCARRRIRRSRDLRGRTFAAWANAATTPRTSRPRRHSACSCRCW